LQEGVTEDGGTAHQRAQHAEPNRPRPHLRHGESGSLLADEYTRQELDDTLEDRSDRLIQSDLSFLALSYRRGGRISSPALRALFVCKGIRKMTTHHTQAGGR
jgi:hypothetical protein